MKKKDVPALLCVFVALFLEMTPWGAVLRFGNPEGEPIRKTFSYFSLVPYGYANFFPLMTAILSSILAFFLLFALIKKSEKASKTSFFLALSSTLISLLPLLYGVANFSLTGAGISLCLALCTLFLYRKGRLE